MGMQSFEVLYLGACTAGDELVKVRRHRRHEVKYAPG